jgi:hypothetical protein
MAKIKTAKQSKNFNEGIKGIMNLYKIEIPIDKETLFLEDMKAYFNTVYKPDNKTVWWQELVNHYFRYYEDLVGEIPAFMGAEAKGLKEVSAVLQRRYLHKNKNSIWDAETAVNQHQIFYDMVITLPFVRQNFSIAFLHNQFDKVVSQLAHKTNRQKEIDEKILAG